MHLPVCGIMAKLYSILLICTKYIKYSLMDDLLNHLGEGWTIGVNDFVYGKMLIFINFC